MYFTLTVENPRGERLTLTEYRSAYQVTYTGLGPVGATVNMSSLGMVNGDKFNSARVGSRNVVLTVSIMNNVEANRLRLYRFFPVEETVKLYYKNGARDVYTEGVVESCDPYQFDPVERVQISILCPQPYLIGAEEIVKDISGITSHFKFPFSIAAEGMAFSSYSTSGYAILHNEGDRPTGFIISVFARNDVLEPVVYNVLTNEAFRLSGTLEAGHTLTIDTRAGHKRMTITDPAGVVWNALHRKTKASAWLELATGDNYISYHAADGAESMLVTLRHNNLFVGV